MLHAAIIDQLCWDPFLRWEIKIDIGQKCDCHWRIKGSQSVPSEQKVCFFTLNPWIFNKKVDTECCRNNKSSTKYDIKWIISKSLSICDSCENRLEKDQGNLLRGIDKCLVMAQSVVVESVRQPWLTVFLYFNSKAWKKWAKTLSILKTITTMQKKKVKLSYSAAILNHFVSL